MLTQLVAAIVVIAYDCRFFECSIHSFDLAVRPGMIGLGQAMLDAVLAAAQTKHVRRISRGRTVPVLGQIGELNAVVGQDSMDFVADRLDERFEKSCRR